MMGLGVLEIQDLEGIVVLKQNMWQVPYIMRSTCSQTALTLMYLTVLVFHHEQVSHAIGTDSRIGNKFLNASVGFGGSCFQKDILNLCYVCETMGLTTVSDYWKTVVSMNDYQKQRFVERIVSSMFNTLKGKKIAVFGFAFKKDTGDTRETPAIDVCRGLIGEGAQLAIYDPKVTEDQMYKDLSLSKFEWDIPMSPANSCEHLRNVVTMDFNPYNTAKGAHAICIMTEWDEFKEFDYERLYDSMLKPAYLFDGRNLVDTNEMRKIGFIAFTIGKGLDPFMKTT